MLGVFFWNDNPCCHKLRLQSDYYHISLILVKTLKNKSRMWTLKQFEGPSFYKKKVEKHRKFKK